MFHFVTVLSNLNCELHFIIINLLIIILSVVINKSNTINIYYCFLLKFLNFNEKLQFKTKKQFLIFASQFVTNKYCIELNIVNFLNNL